MQVRITFEIYLQSVCFVRSLVKNKYSQFFHEYFFTETANMVQCEQNLKQKILKYAVNMNYWLSSKSESQLFDRS